MALDDLYSRLPTVKCAGLCHPTCGPVAMMPVEGKICTALGAPTRPSTRLSEEEVVRAFRGDCPALTKEKRCGIYASRPLTCRLYGVAAGLLCQWGCVPERIVTRDEADGLYREVERISQATIGPGPQFVMFRTVLQEAS